MQTTLFCHFLDEEVLLPGWLNHHKKLFSHGVMLDWGSSDNSADIIKTICPTWEIVGFDQGEQRVGDTSVWKIEQLESRKTGWKCALNVSEYLVIDDLERYIIDFEKKNPGLLGICGTGVYLTDEPGDHALETFRDLDLVYKKKFGFLEYGKAWNMDIAHPEKIETVAPGSPHYKGFRNRLLHKHVSGCYNTGRHSNRITDVIDPNLFISWIGRGSPEFYFDRVHRWKKEYNSGVTNFYGCDWTSVDFQFYKRFWEIEWSKSYNLFEKLDNYKSHLDKLYEK
jgi:hypothetical protein